MDLDLSFYNWALFTSYLQKGLIFSIQLTVIATIGGIIVGTMLALMRLSGKPWLVMPATIYVNTMRSIPLVMVILWFFLLIPLMIGKPIGVNLSAIITFIAFEAAFFSEIVRAGIQSIPRGQVYAGQALGMSYAQNMRLVVLPQAFRNMIPILLTQGIILFQDTSLVYVVGLTDFMGAASKIAQRDGRLVEMYLFAALIYFILCFSTSYCVKRLQSRISPPR